MKTPDQTINYPLRTARKLQGLSQKDLACMLGVTTRTVMRWEQRQTEPHPRHVRGLCAALGRTAKELGVVR